MKNSDENLIVVYFDQDLLDFLGDSKKSCSVSGIAKSLQQSESS